MRAISTILVILIALYIAMLAMDYAAAQNALFGFFEPIRSFLHIIYGIIGGFIGFVTSFFH